MSALAAATLLVLALFGVGVTRTALQDLALLETQLAAQRAAEAAVSFVWDNQEEPELEELAQAEASRVAAANLRRVTLSDVSVRLELSAEALVEVIILTQYSGLGGPVAFIVGASAGIRPETAGSP